MRPDSRRRPRGSGWRKSVWQRKKVREKLRNNKLLPSAKKTSKSSAKS